MKPNSISYCYLILGFFLLSVANLQAQIKIGTNPTTINSSALFEVESADKGILLPRLALQSAELSAPLSAHVAGMIVYNTATAGTGANALEPGFHYNDGARWIKLQEILDATTAQKGVIQLAGDLTGTADSPVIGTGKITSDKIADGTIVDADLNKTAIPLSGFGAAAASVDLGTQKLINVLDPTAAQDAATKKYVDDATAAINTLESGKIYLGNATDVATEVAMSGDVTIDNAGVTTIGESKVVSSMIANGTIIAEDIAVGAVTTAQILDGTILVADLADDAVETAKIKDLNVTPAKLAPGTANQILVTNGTPAVEWMTPTNTLTAVNGQLVSTINGLASAPSVGVLISADNGLTVTDGSVQMGGALTAATTITTDGTNTLAIAGLQVGSNTDKMIVADANGVLKAISPNTRNVLNITKKTADYTIVEADHTILADVTTAGFTITLPDATTSEGRVLLIRKTDETNNVLTFSQSIKYSETTSFTTLNYLSTIRIQSDGTSWYKID